MKFVAVAISIQGTLYKGCPGEIHADVAARLRPDDMFAYLGGSNSSYWRADGFVDRSGLFVSRMTAQSSTGVLESTDVNYN